MNKNDRQPLDNPPVFGRIRSRMNNRLGAVYSALYTFWSARQAAVGHQRDANTIILHAQDAQSVCENDTTRSPIKLLDLLLPNAPKGGNSFDKALKAAGTAISKWWDDTRPPVIIFLSDGVASVSDSLIKKLFREAAQKGCVVLDCTFDAKLTLRAGKDFRCMQSYSVRKRPLSGCSAWSRSHSMRRARHLRRRACSHPSMKHLIAWVPFTIQVSYRINPHFTGPTLAGLP